MQGHFFFQTNSAMILYLLGKKAFIATKLQAFPTNFCRIYDGKKMFL